MDLRGSSLGFYRAWYCALGAKHGLFVALRRARTPETLARETGLDARALATWCRGALALGLLKEDVRGAYRLDAEHARTLGDPEDAAYLGHHFEYLTAKSLHFGALDDLLHGAPASRDLGEVYAIATRWDHVAFFELALPRERALAAQLRRGIDVLDLGAGHGGWARACAARFPKSRIVAADLDITALADVEAVRVSDVPPEAFDLVFLGEVLAAAQQPREVLATARRALRPGATLFALEGLAPPAHRAPRGWGEKLVSAMQLDFGLDGSRFLGRDEALALVRAEGFTHVRARDLGGSLFAIRATKPRD